MRRPSQESGRKGGRERPRRRTCTIEKGNRIGSEAAVLEIRVVSEELPTGLQTTTVEDDNGRLPESSEARLGMNEGNTGARSERGSQSVVAGEVSRPQAKETSTDEALRKSEAERAKETEKDTALREALATIEKMSQREMKMSQRESRLKEMVLKLMTSQGKEEQALCTPQEASTEAVCTEAKVSCAPQEVIKEAPARRRKCFTPLV